MNCPQMHTSLSTRDTSSAPQDRVLLSPLPTTQAPRPPALQERDSPLPQFQFFHFHSKLPWGLFSHHLTDRGPFLSVSSSPSPPTLVIWARGPDQVRLLT